MTPGVNPRECGLVRILRPAKCDGNHVIWGDVRQSAGAQRSAGLGPISERVKRPRRRSEGASGCSWQSAGREFKGVWRASDRGIRVARCRHGRPEAAAGGGWFSHALTRTRRSGAHGPREYGLQALPDTPRSGFNAPGPARTRPGKNAWRVFQPWATRLSRLQGRRQRCAGPGKHSRPASARADRRRRRPPGCWPAGPTGWRC